jgi:hypothetical protein
LVVNGYEKLKYLKTFKPWCFDIFGHTHMKFCMGIREKSNCHEWVKASFGEMIQIKLAASDRVKSKP